MDFGPIAIDVEGGLSNPVALAAVVLWALGLAAATSIWLVIRSAARPRLLISAVAWVLLLLAYISTPQAQRVLGTLLYAAADFIRGEGLEANVGFIGGPPFWQAPAFAFLTGVATALLLRRKSHRNAV
jgi:hypothetical protein